jgi:hypothetical protein
MRMLAVSRAIAVASLTGACACGPGDRDEELRCAAADLDLVAAPEPMPGPCHAQMDRGADGTIDKYEKWVYDAAGRETWIELGNPEGPTVHFIFGYDAQGRMLHRIQEDASTGRTTSRWDREYVSELEAFETWTDGDGGITSVHRIQFDARGNVTSILTDGDDDGKTDSRSTAIYAADNRILESSVERMLDEWTVWYGWVYDYDEAGFLVTTHYDYQQPSTSQHDSITHHTNDEWGNELVAESIDLEDGEHSCTYNFYACDE